MSLPTVNILLQCRTATGAAVPFARVRCKLTHAEVDGALVVPLAVEATADAQGNCTLALWPNERSTQGSQYQVSIATPAEAGGNLVFVGHISVPAALPINQPVPFELLVGTRPYPRVPATEVAVARLQAAEVAIAASVGAAAQANTDAAASALAANNSKLAAAASEANAAGSALAANASKLAATASEGSAGQSAVDANASKLAAAASEGNAAGSATAANNSRAAAASSEANAAGSATAANNSRVAAAASEANAGTSATQAALAQAGAVGASTTAGTQAALAATQANAALAQAGAAAASAASAASVLQQDLSAIASQLHAGTAVAVFVYHTSKDTDGGAWVERCADASWATEPLSGAWLGRAANEAAARALPGAATSAYYQNTTDLKFYRLSAGTGQTETFRGATARMPRLLGLVLEAQRLVSYDLTAPGRPMWDVFAAGTNFLLNTASSGVLTSLFAVQGCIYVGSSTRGCSVIDYASDASIAGIGTEARQNLQSLPQSRNAVFFLSNRVAWSLANAAVSDVSAAVLPGAAPSVAAGLPVATVVVGTGGAINVIRPSAGAYTVLASADATGWAGTSIGPSPGYLLRALRRASSDLGHHLGPSLIGLANNFAMTRLEATNKPDARGFGAVVLPTTRGGEAAAAGWADGAVQLYRGNAAVAAGTGGAVARFAGDHNAGWLFGAVRRCWLAGIASGTSAAAQLVSNPGFDVDTTGWAPTNGAGLAVVSGELQLTANGSVPGAQTTINTVVGRGYVLEATLRRGTAVSAIVDIMGINGARILTYSTTNVTQRLSFIATSTSHVVNLWTDSFTAGLTAFFDNITVRPAAEDLTTFRQGAQLYGSLTWAAVASAAQRVAASGFSAANYCQEPYHAHFDVGTSAFTVSTWVSLASLTAGTIFERGAATGPRITLGVTASGQVTASVFDGTATRTATSVDALRVLAWSKVRLNYSAGTVSVLVNGVQWASTTGAALLTLNNATATATLGNNQALTSPWAGSLCLVKFSLGTPTPEQAAFMVRDELQTFQPNASCCLPTTAAPVDLAFDEATNTYTVAQPTHTSQWRGLTRVAVKTPRTASFTKLAVAQGIELLALGASGVDVGIPAQGLRAELAAARARLALGAEEVFDFTATTGQTAFALPLGYTAVRVASAGTLRREGPSADFTRAWDGFVETINFAVAPGASAWVHITARRFA